MTVTRSGKDLAAVRVTRKGATIHKTNERPGTRAQARYIRISSYKAREVLDLIRGKHVEDADQILQFVERDVAQVVRKVLASAVANAENNDAQDPEALYVSACFADEGPTLKRWRPRARGRATRIRKRTCHITIIVSRLSETDIRRRTDRETAAQAATGGRRPTQSQAATRRARVAKSRQQERQEVEAPDVDHGQSDEGGRVKGNADSMKYHVPGSRWYDQTEAEEWFDTPEAALAAGYEPAGGPDEQRVAPYGEGSAASFEDGSVPDGFAVKGNADSMKYHVPGSRWYDQTIAEVWFDGPESAEGAGFVPAGGPDEQGVEDEHDDDDQEHDETAAEPDEIVEAAQVAMPAEAEIAEQDAEAEAAEQRDEGDGDAAQSARRSSGTDETRVGEAPTEEQRDEGDS